MSASEPGPAEKHLFISYAHRDNQPLLEGQRGWIDEFQRILKVRLGQLLADEPKIWWDHTSLHGNDVFAAVIQHGLVRSAVLVPVLSPSYKASEWCNREIADFCAACESAGGVRVGNGTRIFKVVKRPIDREEEPAVLRDLIGYEFFSRDPVTGRVREYLLHSVERVDPDYLRKIDDLAEDIHCFLDRMFQDHAAAELRDAPERPVLYVAECASDVAPDRERLLRTLRQRGYGTLPDIRLPFTTGREFRSAVHDVLNRSRLSVHLIGPSRPAIPEGETESVAAIQTQLASEVAAGREFPRLVWIAPGFEPGHIDPGHREFIDKLRNDPAGAEILSGSLEELETLIEDRLRPRSKPALKTGDGPGSELQLKHVYLLCSKEDYERAQAVSDWLFENAADVEVALPIFEGDEPDLRAIHTDTLTTCDGVLLYHGQSGEPWLRAKLLEIQKAPGYGRTRPFSAKAICMAPPVTAPKQRFRTRETLVISDFTEPTMDLLSPFLAQLRGGGAQ